MHNSGLVWRLRRRHAVLSQRTKRVALRKTFERFGFDEVRHVARVRFSTGVLRRHAVFVFLAGHHLLVGELRLLSTTTAATANTSQSNRWTRL